MAKSKDKRVDDFRDKAKDFIAENFSDMKDAYDFYMSNPNTYDKGVALYMKLVDKVIPALPTQAADTGSNEKPAWMQKVEKSKKTMENETR